MPAPRARYADSDYKRINGLFNYDKRTGLLTWAVNRGPRIKAGDEAGTLRTDGTIMVVVDGEPWLAHRLIWFLMKGELPPRRLRFVDDNPQNLRWANIALETDRPASPGALYQRDLRARRAAAIARGDLDVSHLKVKR